MTSAPHASPAGAERTPGASASHQAPRGRTFNPDWHLDRHEVARLYEEEQMNELATIVGYEPVEEDTDMLWVLERWHYDGQVRRSGRTPRPGIPWGLLQEPAPELLPVGTVVQH